MNGCRAESRFRPFLDTAVAKGIPGIVAAVASSRGVEWIGTAGLSDLKTQEPVSEAMLFGIGSITKTFVAVVILRLIEQGHLCLDQTAKSILGTTISDVANADYATIAQLLNHTSGIPSWEDDSDWIRQGRGALQIPSRIWGPSEPLEYIRGLPALCAAGERYHYSNTNYTLLGLIIDKTADTEAMNAIREQILKPLGLENIYLESFEPVPAQRTPHRYHWVTSEFQQRAGVHESFQEVRPGIIDVSTSNLSTEWLAGGMIASVADLAHYGIALREGRLLNRTSMEILTDWTAVGGDLEVGHNLFRRSFAGLPAAIGHNGGVLGFSGSLFWLEGRDIVVALACNVGNMHSGTVPASITSPDSQKELIYLASQLTMGNS